MRINDPGIISTVTSTCLCSVLSFCGRADDVRFIINTAAPSNTKTLWYLVRPGSDHVGLEYGHTAATKAAASSQPSFLTMKPRTYSRNRTNIHTRGTKTSREMDSAKLAPEMAGNDMSFTFLKLSWLVGTRRNYATLHTVWNLSNCL